MLRFSQQEKEILEEKFERQKQKTHNLKDKVKREFVDNKNFMAIVEKYKSVIRSLEEQLRQESLEKAALLRNKGYSSAVELTPRCSNMKEYFKELNIKMDYERSKDCSSNEKIRILMIRVRELLRGQQIKSPRMDGTGEILKTLLKPMQLHTKTT